MVDQLLRQRQATPRKSRTAWGCDCAVSKTESRRTAQAQITGAGAGYPPKRYRCLQGTKQSPWLPDLLHGNEKKVWGDAGYQGQTEAIHAVAPDLLRLSHPAITGICGFWFGHRYTLQRMIHRNPLFRRNITEHRILNPLVSAHLRPPRPVTSLVWPSMDMKSLLSKTLPADLDSSDTGDIIRLSLLPGHDRCTHACKWNGVTVFHAFRSDRIVAVQHEELELHRGSRRHRDCL